MVIKVRMVTHEGLFITDLQPGTSDIFLSLYTEEVSFSVGNYSVFCAVIIDINSFIVSKLAT